jgi:hypothetical protein
LITPRRNGWSIDLWLHTASGSVFPSRLSEIKQEMLGGSFSDEEIKNASNMLTDVVLDKYPSASLINFNELGDISKCHSRLIRIKLLNYHTESVRMGQHKGFITIQIIEVFPQQSGTLPPAQYIDQYEASGGINWGNSQPFADAVKAVCREIKRK